MNSTKRLFAFCMLVLILTFPSSTTASNSYLVKATCNRNTVITKAVFTSDEQYIFGIGKERFLKWKTLTGETVFDINLGDTLYFLAISSNDQYIAVGLDEIAIVLNATTGEKVRSFTHITENPYDDGTNVFFTSDNQHLITSGADGGVLWEIDSGKQLYTFPGDMNIYNAGRAEVSLGTNYLVTLDSTSHSVWDTRSGKLVHKWTVNSGNWIGPAIISPDDHLLVTNANKMLSVWDTKRFVRLYILDPRRMARGWEFSPNSRYLVVFSFSAGPDGRDINLWDLKTGKLLQSFPEQEESVHFEQPYAFDATSSFVYLPSVVQRDPDREFYDVTIWNIQKNKLERELHLDQYPQEFVSIISHDGRFWLLDDIGSLMLRDTVTGELLVRYC